MKYPAPAWLPSGHLQTIYPALCLRKPPVHYRRERWDCPDGDFIDVDFVDGQPGQPMVVLFHGLEGSSNSHYARALMAAVAARGWSGAVPHFRGCSGEPNRAPRFYHSGDATEIDWIIRRLHARHAGAPLAASAAARVEPPATAARVATYPPARTAFYAAGVSLGGNALLRWLGESGQQAGLVDAACAVSAPLDLAQGGTALSSGFNMLYTRMFLQTLKPKCVAKLQQYPDLFDLRALHAARDLYDFDNVVTAPLHGYRNTEDYWHRASAKHVLGDIRVPTLVLNARNDPFLPGQHLPQQAAACVQLDYPAQGGHVGFATGALPGSLHWLPQRLLHFMTQGAAPFTGLSQYG